MQLENEYLTEASRGRLQEAYANPVLSPETLIENRHISIERQVEVAEQIIRISQAVANCSHGKVSQN